MILSNKSIETKQDIMRATLLLLREVGAEGLTMRKVAAQCGRNLNNIQYYYKNKTALLIALAEFYCQECTAFFNRYTPPSATRSPQEQLQDKILFALNYASELSEVYIVFRELWAISTRNSAIELQLIKYYKSSIATLCGEWEQKFERERVELAISILLPYLDGYSIQHKAIPVENKVIASVLAKSLYSILLNE